MMKNSQTYRCKNVVENTTLRTIMKTLQASIQNQIISLIYIYP